MEQVRQSCPADIYPLRLCRLASATLTQHEMLCPEMSAYLQAGNRPVDRAIPSPPVELPRGHLNMPNNQESASDHDETSNISTSERSESFTQALQKLQVRPKSLPVI